MNDLSHTQLLSKFYKALKESYLRKGKKIKNNSLLWSLILLKKKDRKEIIDKSIISSYTFNKSDLEPLLENNYIKMVRNRSNAIEYCLSAKGIWFYEKEVFQITENNLLSFFDKEFFELKVINQSPAFEDKIALFSMICLRNFSKHTCMDLSDENVCDSWRNVFIDVADFLVENDYIKSPKSKFDLLNKRGSEHAVSYLMRHRNNLPLITDNIFINPGKKIYWIDIFLNGSLNIGSFTFLLKLVFNNIHEIDKMLKLKDFCFNLGNKYAVYVISNFDLFNSKVDKDLENGFNEFYLSS